MSAEILQLLTRIAELERKLDSLFRHGPVHERKKIEGRWFVRLKIGGADDDPFLSPWIPYSSPNGGPQGLNVHRVPAEGEQLTMLSPAGDPRQAVAASLFWSDDHPPPSDDEDAVTITHPKFKLDLKDGVLKIETKGPLSIECQTFTLKGLDGTGISLAGGKLTLKADLIETDGETRLDKGSKQVHQVQDHLMAQVGTGIEQEHCRTSANPPARSEKRASNHSHIMQLIITHRDRVLPATISRMGFALRGIR